jgi:hypothetical protein
MARAAHLIDHVLPDVPVRHWVLSLPPRLRYLLAWDHDRCRAVSGVAIRAVLGFFRRCACHDGVADAQRRRAGRPVLRWGVESQHHLHALVLDGVFTRDDGAVRFHPAPQLTREDVAEVVALVARRVTRLIERRGLASRAEDGEASDPWSDEAPVLAAVAAVPRRARGAQAASRRARPTERRSP